MSENPVELLFFDTFAHDNSEEINLDLVQFPKPVYVTEVRIIPLGARVQADFPGGVRLGATNPSKFEIQFFVNDLGKPGASTFETLGSFEYDQNEKINLECDSDSSGRKRPTDGLVLKGLYTTITLAVYGTLTNNLAEQLIQPIVNPDLPTQPNTIADAQQIISTSSVDPEWSQDNSSQQPADYPTQATQNFQNYSHQPEGFQHQAEYTDYYVDIPKDPRSYHHTPETDWDKNGREKERSRDIYQERDHVDRRDRRYSRSESKDRDRSSKDYHDNRDRDHDRVDYRSEDHQWTDAERERERDRERDRLHERERGRDRDRDRRHDDYRKFRDEREDRKRPRTPPMHLSPKRPLSPHSKENTPSRESIDHTTGDELPRREYRDDKNKSIDEEDMKTDKVITSEENTQMDVEEFEPILSDEDILDDNEHFQEADYDYTAYTNNDDIIRQFSPGVTELQKYPKRKRYSIEDNTITVEESLKISIGIAEDYLNSSITKYELSNFSQHNREIKEEFVHLCERLIGIMGGPETFVSFMKLYNAVRSLVATKMTSENKELATQLYFVIETVTDWLIVALNYEMANSQEQPAYKIRHIKCGIRLAEWLSHSDEYILYIWNKNFHLHAELLSLYQKEFMALSIKLMVLKALDTYLMNKLAIEKFLMIDYNPTKSANPKENGYKVLVNNIQGNPLVREKYSLSLILKKLNLYEMLSKIHNILIKLRNVSHDVSAEEINLITKSLIQILNYCKSSPFLLSQPKRFLPVTAQFEIGQANIRNVLVDYFKMFDLLQCFVLLLTSSSTLNLPPIKTPIFEIISELLDIPEGLHYISENCDTMNVLLKCMLRNDEEIYECVEVNSHTLGLKIAYRVQSLYHIEWLLNVEHNDCDNLDVIDHLHNLFCLTFSNIGKFSVGHVLGMEDHIKCLLKFFENVNLKSEVFLQKISQSPGSGYILDLLYFPVVVVPSIPMLEKYSSKINEILDILSDASNLSKINEMKEYLSPLENKVNYQNISPFLDLISSNIDTVISHPGVIITSLRILQHIGISKYNKNSLINENPLYDFVELKYKHVILQLYSLDGTSMFVKLLQKLCNHFEQPGLHSSFFVSNQGLALVDIILPTLLLLKEMTAYVIQCRNTDFKDLTAIPVLLKTYNLVNSFPVTASASHKAQQCKIIIIESLLVYTQPISDEFNEKDSLNKTLWAQVLGEVIKFTTTSPYTFVSGLLVLSELLPLPLPIHSRDDLTTEEKNWTINLRKLWSAHLHPHNAPLQDMLSKICISTQPQLLNLLRRICVQISDLAANSALMISRGFLDTVYNALMSNGTHACSSHVAKLLNFLACLVTHSTIKCSVLYLIHSNSTVSGKSEERYSALVPIFCQILKFNDNSNSHLQAQECVLSIIQSFCDSEITLLQNSSGDITINSNIYLANALPIKENLVTFIKVILDYVAIESTFVTYLPIVRTLLLLTEHDYGFYHLQEHLVKRDNIFVTLLNKLHKDFSKTSTECLSTLSTLVEFLRVCLSTEENESELLYDSRTCTLTVREVQNLIGWKFGEDNPDHQLVLLQEILKKEAEEDNNFETMLEILALLLKEFKNVEQPLLDRKVPQEIILPSFLPLLTQYECRIVCGSSDACDERLTDRYWLVTLNEESEGDLETVPCDLFEICRQLPPEFNLIKEVEKLCRISRTDLPNIHKTTKHGEDQRSKTKKPFITPMRPRGFPRTNTQRPDLFRSRPPNTSRPPSLHVDDFVALETCGAQPTGPTGYNKLSREMLASTRMTRGTRGRAFVTSERSIQYNRQMPWWGTPMSRHPYF